LSLFAALNTQSGEVLGQTVPRHTSAAFVDFLGDIVASQPKRRAIHVIADNLSTHKTQAVRTFLLAHPNVRLHFTPTYASWLNQVELWFSKIERDVGCRTMLRVATLFVAAILLGGAAACASKLANPQWPHEIQRTVTSSI